MSDKKKSNEERTARRMATGSRMRAKIEHEIAVKEAEAKREALRKRLDIAKEGVKALVSESFGEATKSFLTYLRLLEISKKVQPKRLHPSLFDPKKELPELVLVTGIYWDLARTFDRMKSNKRERQHAHYLEQFVVFARSAPFKHKCAETLRRYLSADRPTHRADFKAAYKQLGGSTCFVVSSLLDLTDLETLPRLSRFRDEQLLRTRAGRWLVVRYEAGSPAVARMLDRSPEWVRRIAARAVDAIGLVTEKVSRFFRA